MRNVRPRRANQQMHAYLIRALREDEARLHPQEIDWLIEHRIEPRNITAGADSPGKWIIACHAQIAILLSDTLSFEHAGEYSTALLSGTNNVVAELPYGSLGNAISSVLDAAALPKGIKSDLEAVTWWQDLTPVWKRELLWNLIGDTTAVDKLMTSCRPDLIRAVLSMTSVTIGYWENDPPDAADEITNLAPLTHFRYLQSFETRSTQLTDVTPLMECPSLRQVFIATSPVADIMPLWHLSLNRLVLYQTLVHDADVKAYIDSHPSTYVSGVGEKLSVSQRLADGYVIPNTPAIKRAAVLDHAIRAVYHFTRESNLPSITSNGLLPRRMLDERNITFKFNDMLRLDNAEDSISVSIGFPNFKMFYRLRQADPSINWVVIEIEPEILWTLRCAFCKTNAASNTVRFQDMSARMTPQALEEMFTDFPHKKRSNIPDSYPTSPQAEVLVFDPIPVTMIRNVCVKSQEDVQRVQPHAAGVECIAKPDIFSRRCDWADWPSQFSVQFM